MYKQIYIKKIFGLVGYKFSPIRLTISTKIFIHIYNKFFVLFETNKNNKEKKNIVQWHATFKYLLGSA